MAMFKGFKPQGLQKIATRMGYAGSMEKFDDYLKQNPDKEREMIVYRARAQEMARGGAVRKKMQEGGIIGKFPMGNPIPGMFGAPVGSLGTPTQEQPQPKNANTLPDYEAFEKYQSTIPNNMFRMSSAVIVPRRLADGTVVNFGSPLQAEDYDNYLKSIGKPPTSDPRNEDIGGSMPIMTSPGFDPRYEGTDSSAYGQQNQLLSINDLYNQAVIPPTLGGDFSYYRPQPGETLYRNYTEARKANPNMQHSGIYTAVMPPAGTYAIKADGTRVTVPEGFFGPDSNPLPYRINPVDPRNTPAVQPQQAQQQPVTQVMTDPRSLPQQPTPIQSFTPDMDITDVAAQRMSAPGLPSGGQVVGQGITQEAGQYIPTSQGQVTGAVAVPTTLATTTMAEVPTATPTTTMSAAETATAVNTALNATQAAQIDPNDPRAQVTAAQQTASSVGNLNAAQGNATLLNNPVQRQIQSGELVSGAADAETASAYAEQIQAATATPSEKATVQGQLAQLTANFDINNPPAWAAGTLRAIQGKLAARGLGASSIAGQALIQGALESALPIAQADAQTQAQFESQNLSNRQQRAMLAAQQRAAFIGQEFDQAFQTRVQNASRIADVANQNFTAEQQIALENSRVANTMNLQNLSNSQALVMAEASALANLDTANLNNRQQTAVQNAQSFLQRDMANLSNRQQTELFKAQQRVQSLFTDQAAENAARQFNASSQNQTDQFFANLATQTAQFNATQANAQSQYNAGQRNVLERFNAELNNQRDTFNAQNQLVIAQNNAQWRRQIATINTATINRVNEINATNLLQTSNQAYNNLWNYYGDTMEWAWTSAENELNRYADMSIANLNADTQADVARRGASTAAGNAIGSLIGTLGSAYIMSSFGGFCWVAREVYGKADPRWYVFRVWLKYKAPKWFKKLYEKHGEGYAKFIKDKPVFKWATKKLMDLVVKEKQKDGSITYV